MLRIRQRDAELALEGAAAIASGGERILGKSTPMPEPASTEAMSMSASSNTPKAATEKEANLEKVPTSVSTTISQRKGKVLPPVFLTPGTPRKPKSATSLPFALPSSENVSTPPLLKERPQVRQDNGNGFQNQKEAEWTESLKKGTPLPSMPSRPVPDTESWTPKARRRG